MEEVIGLRGTPGHGSLKEWGVTYRELPLTEQGLIDWDALRTAVTPSKLPAGICSLAELLQQQSSKHGHFQLRFFFLRYVNFRFNRSPNPLHLTFSKQGKGICSWCSVSSVHTGRVCVVVSLNEMLAPW